jgi:uncharacterized protein YecE (DUF72 family)
MAAKPRIGCSGWHYKHWVGRYYPEKTSAAKMLGLYIRDFDTVELNNSFYRMPKPEYMRTWRDFVPKNFEFAVKVNRFITHNLKLTKPENFLEKFLPVAEVLNEKLGPILFQTPPSWKCNAERLEHFLSALPRHHHYAFEFREPSWMCAPVFELLRAHNAALVIYEIAGYHAPIELTADWTYIRLHGPGGKYQGSYTPDTLVLWAKRIFDWERLGVQSYVYFDNDDSAYAAHNAIALKRMVEGAEQKAA